MERNVIFSELGKVFPVLYPDITSIHRIVADAGIVQHRIAFTGSPISIWSNILSEAEKMGLIEALIETVLAEYGEYPALKKAAEAYRRATAGGSGDSSKPPGIAIVSGAAPIPLQRPPREEYFVNRKAELKALLYELQPGQVVTLCGPGGMGKTALAAEAIWQLAPESEAPERFPDGILFYSFHTTPQVDLALEHIARSYGEEPQPTPTAAAKRALTGKRALLVLDGTEQADDLNQVLAVRNQCGVLVTSRRRSDSLTIRLDLAPLSSIDTMMLLRAYEGERIPDLDAVQRIGELLGGLPLAVRLAGRVMAQQALDAQEYLAMLDSKSLTALNWGQRQHEGILLVLQQSVDRVSQPATIALGAAGLLALAPFDADMITEILQSTTSAQRALGELVDYGLLLRSDDGRYEVSHTLVHTFAQEKLTSSTDIVIGLAGYFTNYVKKHQNEFGRLAYILPHVLEVLRHCEKRELWAIIQDLVMAIDHYLDLQGYWNDRLATNKIGLAAAEALQDFAAEAAWQNHLGEIYYHLGQVDRATDHYQRALAIARELGNRRDEGLSLGNLGTAYTDMLRWEEAFRCYEQGLAISREIGDRQGEGTSLGNLGRVYAYMGQMDKAISHYDQALLIARETGDRRSEGASLGNLGRVYASMGQVHEAISNYEQALVIAQDIGDRRGEDARLNGLGSAYYTLGQVNEAVGYYQQALTIAQEIGDRRSEGASLGNLGVAHMASGQMEQAIVYCQQALAITKEIGDQSNEANYLGSLGNIYMSLGQTEQAIDYHQQALVIVKQIGDRRAEGNQLGNLGLAYSTLRRAEEAIDHFQRALRTTQEIGDRRAEATWLGNLGRSHATIGHVEKAIESYQQALAIAKEIGDRRGEGSHLENLATVYAKSDQLDKAIQHYCALLEVMREIGDRRGELHYLGDLGDVYMSDEQIQNAIDQYVVALQIANALGDQQRKIRYLRNIAIAYQRLEQIDEALTYYEQLVNLLRLIDSKQAAETLLTMGDLAMDIGQIIKARQYWIECQSIYSVLKSSHVRSVASRLLNLVINHPELLSLREMTQQYMAKAGLEIMAASTSAMFVYQPVHHVWLEHTTKPIPFKVLSGAALDMNMVLELVEECIQLLGELPHCIIVVCDHAPTDGAWLQVAAQRANGINIMPVDDSILRIGLQQNRHRAILLEHLEERYLGPQRDLYDRQNPISDRLNFFGREPLTDQLADNLQQGHAVALFGLRKMGKSSLLNYVRDRLPYPAAVIDLQVNTVLKDIYDRIVDAWLARLQMLQPTLNWQPPPLSGSETPSAYFSRIVRSLLAALEGVRALAQLAVFIDEIELIYPRTEPELTTYLDLARTLRGLAQERLGKFGLIVAGVDPNIVRTNRLFGQQNPFYNFFRIQYLPPLNEQDCIQMIRNIGVQMDLQYTDDALEFVAHISGGHPYWARKLCSLAFKTWKEPGPVTQAHLATMARRFVQNPDTAQLLDQRGLWGEVTDRYLWQEDDAAANEAILLALAESEQRTRTDLLAHTAKPTAYQRSLAELDDRAIIDEVATDAFWIHLQLFRNWIRTDKLGKE